MGNQVVTQQQSNIDEFLKFTKDQVDLSQEFEILTPRRRRTYFTSFITGWEFFESSKEFHVENKGINLQELFTFSDNAVYVVLHTFIKRKRRHDQPKDNQEKKEKQIPKIIENLKENITQRSQTRSFSGYHSTYSQLQNENNGKPKHLMGNTPKMKYDIYVWHGKKVTQITKAVSMSKVLELENFISTDNIQQYLLSLFFNKTFYTTNVGLVLGGHVPSHNIEKTFKKLISFNHLISYLNKRSIPKKKENLSQFSCSESNLISTPTQNKRIQNFINQRNKQLLTQPQLHTPKPETKGVKDEVIEIKRATDSDEKEVSNDKKPKTNNKICNKHASILDSRDSVERIPRVSKSIIHNFEIQLSPRRSKSTLHDGKKTSQYNIQIKSETINEDEGTTHSEGQDSEIEGIQVTENDSGPISNLKINITHINSNNDNSNPQSKLMIPKLQLNISNIDPNNNNNTTDNAIIPPQTPSKLSIPKLQLNINSPNENTDINIPTSPKKKEKTSKINPPKSPDNKKRRKKKKPDVKKLKTHRDNSSVKSNSNSTTISTSRHHKLSGKKNSLSFGVSLDINLVKRELAKNNSNTNNPHHNNNNNMGFGSLNITKTSSPPTSPTANYLPFNLPERIRYYDAICSQITDQIFLGSNTIAKDQEKLQTNGITHVLNCAASVCDNYFPDSFHYKAFKLADTPNEDITTLFYEVLDYIDNVVSNNGKVFVHCYQGISRSASMVILYLMWKNKTKFSETHEYVKRIREIANPNAGFICQLMLFFQRKKVSPIIPCLYQVRPHKTANDAIGLRYCDTSEGLDDSYCYLVQNSLNHLYLWKGNNIHPDYLEYTFIYAQRLQKFEGFQSELFIEESGQESSEFKSLLQFRSESLKSRKP